MRRQQPLESLVALDGAWYVPWSGDEEDKNYKSTDDAAF